MGEENFPNADEQKELSNHIRQIAQTIYEAELRREDSLIQQSTQMQTAFSFTSAALFMVAAIAVEYKYPLTYGFLLLTFSTITALLLASLILATVAQKREKRNDFVNIKETSDFIQRNYETIESDAAKDLQYIALIEKVQSEVKRTNDNKVVLIQWSMRLFYTSIGLSVFWFLVALIKMKGHIS